MAAIGLMAGIAVGCFRQTVETGRTPANVVIDRPWTSAWLFGLVPATPIDVSTLCRSGVATVVTRVSAANLLVSVATLGLWTPRHVTINCSTGSASRVDSRAWVLRESAR